METNIIYKLFLYKNIQHFQYQVVFCAIFRTLTVFSFIMLYKRNTVILLLVLKGCYCFLLLDFFFLVS